VERWCGIADPDTTPAFHWILHAAVEGCMVERGLVTAEVVAVLALGAWVAKSLQTRAARLEV